MAEPQERTTRRQEEDEEEPLGAAALRERQEEEEMINSFGRTKLKDPMDFQKFLTCGEVEFTMEPRDPNDPLDTDDDDDNWSWDSEYKHVLSETDEEDDSKENTPCTAYGSTQEEHDAADTSIATGTEESSSPEANNEEPKPIVKKTLTEFDDILEMKEADAARREKESLEIPNFSPIFDPSSTKGMRAITDDGELLKRIDHPGKGKMPTYGSKVWVHFEVYRENDSKHQHPIDSTYRTNKPLSFVLFSHDVLAVLEYGVASMEVKEKSAFLASPKYAYGPLGVPGICEANTNCVFRLELLDFVDETLSKDLFRLSKQEQANFGFQQVMEAATQFKTKGNRNVKKRVWSNALQCYRKGVLILDRHLTVDSNQESQRNDLLFIFYNNMAQCYLGIGDGRRAISNCAKAQQLPPGTNGNRCKLVFREAKGYKLLGNVDKALETCRKAMTIEPGNPDVLAFYKEISSVAALDDVKSKDVFQKIANGYFAPPKSAEKAKDKEATKLKVKNETTQ